MAKIAVELQQALARRKLHGGGGHPAARVLAEGEGWRVADVMCTSGPEDRAFEERHSNFAIAIVAAGSFEYRGACGIRASRELMTPGSLLLGSAEQCFECGHDHGAGDRCISFQYAPAYFERLVADAGMREGTLKFGALRVPPLREMSPLIARACMGVAGGRDVAWEEIGLRLAARTVRLVGGLAGERNDAPAGAVARVTRSVRLIERSPDAGHTVVSLAREAGLSPYHYLRTFERVTGVTPHQYLLRARLRVAAMRIAEAREKVVDVALDCGFGDVSNFNRAFRAEFGVSPRVFRRG